MRKVIISLIMLFGLAPFAARADEPALQDNLPERYVVVPGDTLWGISAHYLKDPWRWPDLWRMNRDEIKNPHWIYPGDVIVLVRNGDSVSLKIQQAGQTNSAERETIRLSPSVQTKDLGIAISSIPRSAIDPFLSKSRIVDIASFTQAPVIIASSDHSVILGAGNVVYVKGIGASKIRFWQIYRRGKQLIDPESKQPLGFEVDYVGEGHALDSNQVSSVEITKSSSEIMVGDRLLPAEENVAINYVPHAPSKKIDGSIVAVQGDDTLEIARGSILTINRGLLDGLEIGSVLAVYRTGQVVGEGESAVSLPDDRRGLIFVFKTFEHLSYALVVQSDKTISDTDRVRNP